MLNGTLWSSLIIRSQRKTVKHEFLYPAWGSQLFVPVHDSLLCQVVHHPVYSSCESFVMCFLLLYRITHACHRHSPQLFSTVARCRCGYNGITNEALELSFRTYRKWPFSGSAWQGSFNRPDCCFDSWVIHDKRGRWNTVECFNEHFISVVVCSNYHWEIEITGIECDEASAGIRFCDCL